MEREKNKIERQVVCFHLLNNYSGSPYMLSLVIRALIENDLKIILYTSKCKGFLSDINNIEIKNILYSWSNNKIYRSFIFILTQIQLFFIVFLKYSFKKNQVFYINTILPFGASMAAKILKKEIIYHVHEQYIKPNLMQTFALWVMKLTASKVIFVSRYLQDEISVKQKSYVVLNSLSPEFKAIAKSYLQNKKYGLCSNQSVLMVSSLKTYKGVLIFLEIARSLPEYQFCLVAGTSQRDVTSFIKLYNPPLNLTIYSEQPNLHRFYQNSGIIINLTIPQFCIETFGLTILEGMAYGIPAIAPPIGGPAELVKDGISGHLINPQNIEQIILAIRNIFENEEEYFKLSISSITISNDYSFEDMKLNLSKIVNVGDETMH